MFGIFKYSHLHAKLRAMKGRLLETDDYIKMLELKNVKAIADYLKNSTTYTEALALLDENDVHRGRLEILLYRAEIMDTLKIARYLKGYEKKVYRYVYRRQEIEDIKKMLRTLQMGKKLSDIDRKSLFISWHSVINFNKTLAATTIKELIEALKDTYYYPILAPLRIDEHSVDLYAAEMALDLFYFRTLEIQLKKLFSGRDKYVAQMLFGMEADFVNIMWIYRGKVFYGLQKEMLYRYSIPLHYKLNNNIIEQLIEAQNIDEFKQIIEKSYYGKFLTDDIKEWDFHFKYHLYKTMKINFSKYAYSMSPVMAYIVLKEVEIYNITTIIEGIRYDLDSQDIKDKLVMDL